MVNLVPQIVFFGFFNIIALVTAGGRLFDAVVDPFIAGWSDRNKNPKGRRVPMMAKAIIPMMLFAILMFFPPFHSESKTNLVWLALIQLVYYFFYGMYIIPYNALLAELGRTPESKIHLSTAQSVGFIVGMVVASSITAIAASIKYFIPAISVFASHQYAIIILNVLGAACMFIPVLFINEKKYVVPAIVTEPVLKSLKTAFANPHFRVFALADASFFMCIALISAGLLYYVKAILLLPESAGTLLMGLMVLVTLIFFPLVTFLAKKLTKKKLIISAFFAMALVFLSLYRLGHYPLSPVAQAVLLMVIFGIPNAFLNVLPTALLAEIADADAKATGQRKEGMYFGMRALFQKFGQTLGIMIFSILTLYGKDPGHDLGLRLNGIAGALLCVFAGLVYTRYKE